MFHSADLRKAQLNVADLSHAFLVRTNLMDADLEKALLRDAILVDANLQEARLAGADLFGADLRGADLSSADLSGANLAFAKLRGGGLGFDDFVAIMLRIRDHDDQIANKIPGDFGSRSSGFEEEDSDFPTFSFPWPSRGVPDAIGLDLDQIRSARSWRKEDLPRYLQLDRTDNS